MSALELVRTAVLNVLQAADIPAAAAYSDDWAAAYEAPVLTVGVGGGGSLRVGFHDYLGEWYDEKTASLTIQAGGCTITLAGGKVTVDAPSGVEVTTTVTAATEVTAGAIKLTQHTHTGVHGETSKPH